MKAPTDADDGIMNATGPFMHQVPGARPLADPPEEPTSTFPSHRLMTWICIAYGVLYYGYPSLLAAHQHDRFDCGLALGALVVWSGMVCLIAWAERR